jgi:hypothetical protein
MVLPAYALIAMIAAIDSSEWVQPQLLTALAIGFVAVLLPVWLLRQPPPRRGWTVFVAVTVITLLAGYAQQSRYFEHRYHPAVAPRLDNPGFRASEQWQAIQAWAVEQHNLKIGIVGTPAAYGQYVFYGDDLSNEVRYLGESRPHGGLGPIASCEEWNRKVREGHFDVIVVTPEDTGTALLPQQLAWTRLGRGTVPILFEPPAAVYRIVRPPNPAACAIRGQDADPRGFLIPGLPPGAPVFHKAPVSSPR